MPIHPSGQNSGNAQQASSQPDSGQAQSNDSRAMAQAFAQALKEQNLVVAPAGQQQAAPPPVSKFKTMLEAIAANPDSDAGTVNSIKSLFEAYSEDLKETMTKSQQEEAVKVMSIQRDGQAKAFIQSIIEDLAGDDDPAVHKFISTQVFEELNTSPEYQEARDKYARFDIDTKAIKKCVKAEVDKLNKIRGKEPKSKPAAGMTTSDRGNSKILESGGSSDDYSSLSPKQRDLYNARLGTAQRMGWDRDSEKAKTYALDGARRLKG